MDIDNLLTDLAERARLLAQGHGLEISEDPAMCFNDERLQVLEQACHELAHALQLELPMGMRVSDAVSIALDTMTIRNREVNEVRCFTIVEEVFWMVGIGRRWNLSDAIAALEIQIDRERWGRLRINQEWARFGHDGLPLAERIVVMLREIKTGPLGGKS